MQRQNLRVGLKLDNAENPVKLKSKHLPVASSWYLSDILNKQLRSYGPTPSSSAKLSKTIV